MKVLQPRICTNGLLYKVHLYVFYTPTKFDASSTCRTLNKWLGHVKMNLKIKSFLESFGPTCISSFILNNNTWSMIVCMVWTAVTCKVISYHLNQGCLIEQCTVQTYTPSEALQHTEALVPSNNTFCKFLFLQRIEYLLRSRGEMCIKDISLLNSMCRSSTYRCGKELTDWVYLV